MAKAVTVYQYEQPRCPEGWNESERRFYARIIETLDDIYSKYGRIDEKLLSSSFVTKVNNAPDVALEKLEDAYSSATVDDLMTKSLTANAARIVELTVEKMIADTVVAGQITAGTLEATFAYMVSLSAKFGSFDFETVQNLVSGAMVLEKGSADSLYIKNLSVLYAQILNATIGSLCIQASDGNYYQIDVTENSDGEAIVNATKVEVNEGEISSGQTESGKVILDTDILAERLTTGTLFATEALTNSLLAAKIDVDTLTARSAFIQKLTSSEAFIDRLVSNTAFIHELTTRKIIGEKSLEMIAGTADAARSAAEAAQGTADAAKSAAEAAQGTADGAQSVADTARSAAEAAQGTADGAMLATAHVGVNPPEAPIPAGRQWLDQGVEPWTLRSWIGADVRTEPEYAQTHSGNPVVLDVGRVLSLDSIRNSFGPVQAGSGDPYPAGGGKNLLNCTSIKAETSTINGVTFTAKADGSITVNGTATANTILILTSNDTNPGLRDVLLGNQITISGCPSGGSTGKYALRLFQYAETDSRVDDTGSGVTTTFVNADIAFNVAIIVWSGVTVSNIVFWPMIRFASETDNTFAPYANIRSISGWTGAKLSHCGKNLFGLAEIGGVDASGVEVANATARRTPFIPCVPGEQFAFSKAVEFTETYNNGVARLFDAEKKYIGTITPLAYNALSNVWTVPNGAYYFRFVQFGYGGYSGVNLQIERGGTVTEFDGDSYAYAASFGQTVYGGTLDWAAGVLAVDRAMVTLSSSINMDYIRNTGNVHQFNLYPGLTFSIKSANAICSHYKIDSKAMTDAEYTCFYDNGPNQLIIRDTHSTVADFKSYLDEQVAAGTPVQVCYRLAEPVVVQLKLPAVYPLEGTNVLYVGTGALEVDSTASGWRVVNDPAELQSAQEALALQQARMDEALNRLGMAMVLDADGVHVHRPVTNPPCETLTADDSFNVLVNSAIAATFAASYQKMGGQIVVRQTSNGLIFGG